MLNGDGPAVARFQVTVERVDSPMGGEDGISTVVGMAAEVAASATSAAPGDIAPRPISGRYRGYGQGLQLELRIDVDGERPTNHVSGDILRTVGATTEHPASFVVISPTVSATSTEVKIEGTGSFNEAATHAPFVRVTIPRTAMGSPSPATVQFLTSPTAPAASTTFLCAFESPFFRTVLWEQDSVAGVTPFASYDTGLLTGPPDSAARVLSVMAAFAEAGIELQTTGQVIPSTGEGDKWTDAELHNAMVQQFSQFGNRPQWRTWLLAARSYDDPRYRGVMFDFTDEFQRQGCAVFHDAFSADMADPAKLQRQQLRAYVHELGHTFNLVHPWELGEFNPPRPLGPNGGKGDLTWMHYPHAYEPAGGTEYDAETAYWAAFPFQFTDSELVHLRHGFYRDVVMGGTRYWATSTGDIDQDLFDAPIVDNSGLALELRAEDGLRQARSFAYGEPVVVELKLSTTDMRGRDTHGYLHPKDRFVTILIRQPSGRTVVYRPLLYRCVDKGQPVRLDSTRPAIYESTYIGFGRDGFYFDQPGQYALRAQYLADDGSRVVSPILRFRVRWPVTRADAEVGELLMDHDQGKLLFLLGSDAQTLRAGNDALDLLVDKHGSHSLAVYARMLQGINAEREFKDLTATKELKVRPAMPEASVALLNAVEKASQQAQGVDNVTLNMVMDRQADAWLKAGSLERALKTEDRKYTLFKNKKVNEHVLKKIEKQVVQKKAELEQAAEAM